MPAGKGTYGSKRGRPPKKKKGKKRKQIMAGKRLDLFNHDKKVRAKGAYHM